MKKKKKISNEPGMGKAEAEVQDPPGQFIEIRSQNKKVTAYNWLQWVKNKNPIEFNPQYHK